MPLTPFQEQVARLLSVDRSPDSYLAGGAAMHIAPGSQRFSNDQALEDAEAFIAARPPAELGCLYYSRKRQKFVSEVASPDADVVVHHGSSGGSPVGGKQ